MNKTNQTFDNIQKTFVLGLSGVFKITGFRNVFWGNWVSKTPIIISFITLTLLLIFKVDPFPFILELKNVMISFLPGILSFTIAGFALMVGFIQSGMLNEISEQQKDSNFSLYQIMSAKFALNIILQAIALLISYFTHFVVYFDSNKKLYFDFPVNFYFIVNHLGVIILVYWLSFSFILTIQIVLNIFGFSQLHHYFIVKEKIVNLNDAKSVD